MLPDASPGVATLDDDIPPDYLLVGTVTRDIVEQGFVPGGTVTYAGRTAVGLGARVAVVTSTGPGMSIAELLPGIDVRVRPAPATTTFENVYSLGRRTQWIRDVALPLPLELIPTAWRRARIAHLAPLVNDVGIDVVEGLRGCALLGVTPQGWLRVWDEGGLVRRCPLRQPESTLARCDVVILSEADVDHDWEAIERWASIVKVLVATQGDRGCTVFEADRRWRVPAFPAKEIDATGAGDVFAAAFLLHLSDTGDPIRAARFANCVASFAVETVGPPDRILQADVERRLRAANSLPVVAE